jgi:hypothetical protein
MRRALALTSSLAVLVLLTGCGAPSPSLDLSAVFSDADAPVEMSWVASGAELTAGEDLETISHEWEDSAGEPQACLPLYLVPYGVAPADEGSTDRTVEVGYLAHDRYPGSILVNAREFATEQAATEYIQHALESANGCPGYTVGEYTVGPDGFAIARFTGGHGLSIDGGHVVNGVSSRTAVVRAGRTILIVDAFLFEAPDFDPGVVDELARTMLDRLGFGA